jgi:hypothetical protein
VAPINLEKKFLQPIVFILLVAGAFRLIGITAPVIGSQAWRQADTAAMARNFYEGRFNILYPQIDWGGDSSGYVESEFPIYSFAVACLYKVFGFHEFLARGLSAIFSLVGIFFVFLLGRRLWDERSGFWAAGIFAFLPLQIYYSRTIMPESFMIMSLAISSYLFFRWYEDGKTKDILLSALFLVSAALIKPYLLYMGLPFAYLAWKKQRTQLFVNPKIWLSSIMVLAPLTVWYYHAHRLYLDTGLTFGVWGYGSDKWGIWSMTTSMDFWKRMLMMRFLPLLAYFGIFLFIIGLYVCRKSTNGRFLIYWCTAFLVSMVIVAGGYYAHDYYSLPFLLPASLLMGKVLGDNLAMLKKGLNWKKALLALCVLGMVVMGARSYYLYIVPQFQSSPRIDLANQLMEKTSPDDRVATTDKNDPSLLYLSHRKGWRGAIEDYQFFTSLPGVKAIAGFRDEARPFIDLVNDSR